jgi:hypothetical protein
MVPWRKSGRGVKLTTYLHLVTRLRTRGAVFFSYIRLHGVVLSYVQDVFLLWYFSTGTTSTFLALLQDINYFHISNSKAKKGLIKMLYNLMNLMCSSCMYVCMNVDTHKHTGAGIAQWCSARLRAGWSGIRVPAGGGNFSLHRVQTSSGAHPASYPMGTRGSFPGMKLTTHIHLVPRSRLRGAIPPLPHYAFMAWCSVKARKQLYLYLYLTHARRNTHTFLTRNRVREMLWNVTWGYRSCEESYASALVLFWYRTVPIFRMSHGCTVQYRFARRESTHLHDLPVAYPQCNRRCPCANVQAAHHMKRGVFPFRMFLDCVKLHNDEFHNLRSSFNIVRVIKSRRMR